MVGELNERVEAYSNGADNQMKQVSAFNFKSAVQTGVTMVNGLLAAAVMDAEQPPDLQSAAYNVARNVVIAALKTGANRYFVCRFDLVTGSKQHK